MFRNILNNAVGETAGVTQDVGSDPTVRLPLCLLCGSVIICEGRVAGAAVEGSREGSSSRAVDAGAADVDAV